MGPIASTIVAVLMVAWVVLWVAEIAVGMHNRRKKNQGDRFDESRGFELSTITITGRSKR